MNERIKLLAEQAGPLQEVLSEIHGGTPGRYVKNKALLDFQLEKFAELIVAECMEVCRQGKYGRKDDLDTIQFDNGIRFCINAIDEHFGD